MSTLKVLTILGKAGANPDFPQGVRVRGIELVDANSEISVPLAGAAAEVLAGEPHRVKGADGLWRNALLQGNMVVPMVNAAVTLTLAEFNNNSFDVTGVLTANVALILPLNSAQTFVVDNKTTGLFTLTVKNAGGDLGVIVAQGVSQLLYSNGAVVEGVQAQAAAHTHVAANITDFAVAADLRVARGQAGGTAALDVNQEVLELPAGAASAAAADPTQVLQADGTWAVPASGGGGGGKVLQVVGKTIATQGFQVIAIDTDTQVGAGSDFIMNITPLGANSKFIVEYRWFGEVADTRDCLFNIHRDGVRVNNAGDIQTGLSMATLTNYATDNAGSPEMLNIRTLDQSGSSVGVAIAYKLVAAGMVYTKDMWTNRTFTNGVQTYYEHGISEVIITEIAA